MSAVIGGRDETTVRSNEVHDLTAALHRDRYTRTPRLSSFVFRFCFHFPRAKAIWSIFSNQRMETSPPHSSVRVPMKFWAIEGDSTPDSFVYSKGKHTFLERRSLKNTWPFMRLIEVKEKARVFEEQARIQSDIGERCTWTVKKKFWCENTM